VRVCPKCGHHDPWYWRGSGLVAGLEFCRFSDFKQDYQQIADALLKTQAQFGTKNFVFDKDYCYHLTKGMNVERQSLIENPDPKTKWHIPCEGSPTKPHIAYGIHPAHHGKTMEYKGQKKLLEVSK